jgi:O-antigen/teichoic acid export membrane protein
VHRLTTAPRLGFLRPRAATLGTNATLLLVGLLTSAALSRLLGPEGRGLYVTWQAWASALAIAAAVGLPQVVVLDAGRVGRHRLRDLLAPLAVTGVLGVVAAVGAGLLFLDAGAALLGVVLVVAVTQLAAVAAGEAQRAGRMTGAFNVVRLAPPAAAVLAIGVLATTEGRSPAVWLAGVSAAQVGVLVLALYWVTRPVENGPSGPVAGTRMLGAAARLAPTTWVTMLQYRADLLAVAVLFPPSVVGFYAVGVAAQTAVAAAGQVGGQHWFARSRTAGPRSLRRELVGTAALSVAVAAVVGVSAPWWIPAVYGAAFAPALPLVAGMCLVAVVQSVDYLLAHEVMLSGRGTRIAVYRAPGIALLAIGLVAVAAVGGDALTVVALSGTGYAVSVAVMVAVVSRRRSAGRRRPGAVAVDVGVPGAP